jgi:hypothetical protein
LTKIGESVDEERLDVRVVVEDMTKGVVEDSAVIGVTTAVTTGVTIAWTGDDDCID